MTQIKIFEANTADDLEEAVNKWLRENSVKVKCVATSETDSGHSIVVCYEEGE